MVGFNISNLPFNTDGWGPPETTTSYIPFAPFSYSDKLTLRIIQTERICNAGRFSEVKARYFFQQLISGVHYCHFMQICHRDLKLENTLLDGSPPPWLKICDFGYCHLCCTQNPKSKYEQLLFFGKNLKPLDTQFKIDQNKVKWCVSQVWLRAYFDNLNNKNVIFEADSDTLITKGLATLLVQGLSGSPEFRHIHAYPDSKSPPSLK